MSYWKNLVTFHKIDLIKVIAYSILFTCISNGVYGQKTKPAPDKPSPSTTTKSTISDSTAYVPQTERYSVFKSFSGKPGRAALAGLILPGGGQIYNRKFVKSAVLIGAEIGVLLYAIDRTNYYNRLDTDFFFLLDENNAGMLSPNFMVTEVDIIRSERQSATQQKDFAWLGLGILHLLVVSEAFVDRHLMEFDVSDDLSFNINPKLSSSISLSYRLN